MLAALTQDDRWRTNPPSPSSYCVPEAWDTKAGMTQPLAFQAQREGQKPFFLHLFTVHSVHTYSWSQAMPGASWGAGKPAVSQAAAPCPRGSPECQRWILSKKNKHIHRIQTVTSVLEGQGEGPHQDMCKQAWPHGTRLSGPAKAGRKWAPAPGKCVCLKGGLALAKK